MNPLDFVAGTLNRCKAAVVMIVEHRIVEKASAETRQIQYFKQIILFLWKK